MLFYEEETKNILIACMNVHNELGSGFLEAVYQSALELEFKEMGIPYRKEAKIEIFYKEKKIDQVYYVDFICYERFVIELKAVTSLVKAHKSQVLNYLKGSNLEIGYLVNFGENSLKWQRITTFKESTLVDSNPCDIY